MKGISFLFLLVACSAPQTVKVDPDPIRSVFNSRSEKYLQCFIESDTYQLKKKFEGHVKVKLHVIDSGIVRSVDILETSFNDPNLSTCIKTQLKELIFPKLEEVGASLELIQPINFYPKKT